MRVLIVDDDLATRKLLGVRLRSWGYEPVLASNGEEAWSLIQSSPVPLVISDWNMPLLDGVQLCRRVRGTHFEQYVYIVLCTGRDEKSDLISGLDAGADAFLTKPVNFDELRVALRGASRVLELESTLRLQNDKLRDAYTKLSDAYQTIERDLKTAATLQRQLLPERQAPGKKLQVEYFFSPARYLAGDIFSYFPLNEGQFGFYQLDVSGHGTSAALLCVSLSRIMSHSAAERTILYEEGGAPRACNLVLEQLNDRFQNTLDDMYFTMVYGIIDVSKQIVEFSQGGHPNPICISAGRRGGTVGVGGFPVGMLAPMEYDQSRISFHPGDRLFVYSDGIIECTNKRDEAFGVARLVSVLEASASETLQHQVDRVKNALWEWRGSEEFEDDLSLLAFQAL